MIGAAIAIILVGGVLVLAAVVYLLRCALEIWEDDQRRRNAQIANQVAALRTVLQVELAGRHALMQLSQLDRRADTRSS